MRELLALACRAFPRDHRARRSDEVVDTALLAAEGSARRATREALSLVRAGVRQRLRGESHRSLRDGCALLAGLLALVNLAVALAGITARLDFHGGLQLTPGYGPYVIDAWWIAFVVAAVAAVVGIALGNRRLALGGALANLGVVAYDAVFLVGGSPYDGRGHLDVFTYTQTSSFPAGRQWLAAAVVLAAAAGAAAPLRRASLTRLLPAFGAAVVLVALSRLTWGAFFFLRWPLAVVVLLAVAFGTVAPRLAVLALGSMLAALPSVVGYLTAPNLHHDPVVTAVVVAGLALGTFLPLTQLTRRRLA